MKILVVEDEVRVASLLRKGLESAHHVVDVAQDGEEGLRMAGDGHYDLLLLDVMLPKMDGLVLCRTLRGAGVQTPILMLTARDSLDDKITGLEYGADDYMVKPFSFEELLARITALGRRLPRYVEAGPLQAGDLILNPATHEVERGGRPLQLTGKEFAVLELLLRNPNHVLSREIILDRVWGSEYDPVTNVVDAVMVRLRQKVDKDAKTPLIKTVRGFGYKIEP